MKLALTVVLLVLAIGGEASADVVMSLNLDVNSAENGSGTDYGTLVGTITFNDSLSSMTQYDFTYTPTANSIAPAFTFDGNISTTEVYEDGTYTQSFSFAQVQPYSEFFFQYVDYQDHYNYTLSLATLPGVTLVDGLNTFNRVGALSDVQFQYQTGTGPHGNLMTTFGDVLGTLTAVPEPPSWLMSGSGSILLLASAAWARRKGRVRTGASRA